MRTFPFVIRHSSFVILFMILLTSGCHKKFAVQPPPPIPETTAPTTETAPAPPPPAEIAPSPPVLPEPAPPSKITNAKTNLDLGEVNFQAGRYVQAIRSLESYLKSSPKSDSRDKALFFLGLSYAMPAGSIRDLPKAEVTLKRLIAEFPRSQYKNQAEFILGLLTKIDTLQSDAKERDEKIKRLSEELQNLKDIDMQRRPSRPSE
jgi:TolA-binding protein